jgi:AsmA protein
VAVLGTVVLLAVVALGAAFLLVDANSFKPRLMAELTRATGRDVTIDGPLKLEAAFPPTVSAEGVAIANVEGGSRRQLATIRRVVARLDATALFDRRIVVDRIELERLDLLLETDAQGRPNWRLTRQAPTPTPSATPQQMANPPAAAAEPRPTLDQARFALRSVSIRDGVATWRDPRGVREIKLDLASLDATTSSTDGPVNLTGEGRANGAPFALAGQTGPLTRLFDRAPGAPWPAQLTLLSVAPPDSGAPTVATARLALNGTVAEPARARGYSFTFEGTAPDLAALAPAAGLPHLMAVIVSGHIADTAGPLPEISQLKLQAGPSDLSALVPGLTATQTDLSIPAATEPMQVRTRGTLTGAPFDFAATLGAPASLMSGRENSDGSRPTPTPFPLELAGTVAGLKLAAKGDIAEPASLSGVNVAVQASVADLSTLAPLLGNRLPPLHDATFSGRIADGPGGDRHTIAITEAKLSAGPGDLSGDATLTFGPRFKLQATLVSKLIDIDAVRAMIPPAETPAGEPTAAAPGPAPTHTIAAPTPLPPPPPPPSGAPPTPVLDRTLPFAALAIADADLA